MRALIAKWIYPQVFENVKKLEAERNYYLYEASGVEITLMRAAKADTIKVIAANELVEDAKTQRMAFEDSVGKNPLVRKNPNENLS